MVYQIQIELISLLNQTYQFTKSNTLILISTVQLNFNLIITRV